MLDSSHYSSPSHYSECPSMRPQLSTVLGYLCDCAASGQLVDLARLVTDCQIQLPLALKVVGVIRRAEVPAKLGEVKKALEADGIPEIDWYHIKLVAALIVRKALWFSGPPRVAPSTVAAPAALFNLAEEGSEGNDSGDFDFEAMEVAVETRRQKSLAKPGPSGPAASASAAVGGAQMTGAASCAGSLSLASAQRRALPQTGAVSAWVTKGASVEVAHAAASEAPLQAACSTMDGTTAVLNGNQLRTNQLEPVLAPAVKRALPASFLGNAKRRQLND